MLGNKVPGTIDRTTDTSYLRVANGYLPDFLQRLRGPLSGTSTGSSTIKASRSAPSPRARPSACSPTSISFPRRTTPSSERSTRQKVLDLLLKAQHDLKSLPANATDADAAKVFDNLKGPLMELSKCPDYVVNRGHYFGTSYFAEEPATQRRRQTRPDRIPKDILRKLWIKSPF